MKAVLIFGASSLVIAALLTVTTRATAQGSLIPPGPPGPTMKTLQQIEPRAPIAVPNTITAPGSYYLTNNATVTGTAIYIRCGDVTLDLNGFTVTGDGGDVDYGVWVEPTNRVQNITVRNGNFRNFAAGVVTGGVGIDNVLVENIQMNTGPYYGVWIGGSGSCNGVVVRNNVIVGVTLGISVVAFPGELARAITISNNRISTTGNNYGINLHGQNGLVRDVAILNNQISTAGGIPIAVTTSGTGTVVRVLVDGNYCARGSAGLGILVPTNTSATVIRNVVTGGTLNVATNGNIIGPVISITGVLGTNGAAMSPWANFQN